MLTFTPEQRHILMTSDLHDIMQRRPLPMSTTTPATSSAPASVWPPKVPHRFVHNLRKNGLKIRVGHFRWVVPIADITQAPSLQLVSKDNHKSFHILSKGGETRVEVSFPVTYGDGFVTRKDSARCSTDEVYNKRVGSFIAITRVINGYKAWKKQIDDDLINARNAAMAEAYMLAEKDGGIPTVSYVGEGRYVGSSSPRTELPTWNSLVELAGGEQDTPEIDPSFPNHELSDALDAIVHRIEERCDPTP